MFIATLIAADRLSAGDISLARDALAAAGIESGEAVWIEPEKAADLRFSSKLTSARAALAGLVSGVDIVVQPETGRAKKLLVADMDSTMITVECLDELADYAGFKPQVAAITERAMRGEVDFASALAERVLLLKGLDADIITRCHDDRVAISPGAKPLVRTMKANGARSVLVSGGFTLFAERVGQEIGFDRVVANHLDIESNSLSGTVSPPIVDGAVKEAMLREETAALGLDETDTLAIGDGANDIAMIKAAGLGIAYRAKPRTQKAADARLDHSDLSGLLYAQGYARKDWVED